MQKEWEWIKACFYECINISSVEKLENDYKEIENQYKYLSKDQQENIVFILNQNFDSRDLVYVLSFIKVYTKIKDFDELILSSMIQIDVDICTRCMLEIQTIVHDIGCYSMKRILHRKNVKLLHESLALEIPYIPVEKRNEKRMAIITEQYINNGKHAPSIMLQNFVYVLKKYLGYEVDVYLFPSNKKIEPIIWCVTYGYNCLGKGVFVERYDDIEIEMQEVSWEKDGLDGYRKAIKRIYERKPLFVLNLGVNNPIADIPMYFTTVAERNMISECPISEADILFRTEKRSVLLEEEYERMLLPYQEQFFIKERIPVLVKESGINITREELGLPKDKFLIAIVGNRLNTELNEEFFECINKILEVNSDVGFVFIGQVNALWTNIESTIPAENCYNLGYCRELYETYKILDMYMNPKRIGGGFSAEIAMEAGLPIVTLPDCDVSYRAGANFVVESYDEMVTYICKCVEDKLFFEEKRKMVKERVAGDSKERLVQYVKNMISIIESRCTKDNGKLDCTI